MLSITKGVIPIAFSRHAVIKTNPNNTQQSVICVQNTVLILGLRPANERRRYFVTTSLISWA